MCCATRSAFPPLSNLARPCDRAVSGLLHSKGPPRLRDAAPTPSVLRSTVGGPHAWRAISALPPVAQPSESSPTSPPPSSAESDFPTSQLLRSAPGLRHNTAAPFARSHRTLSQLPLPRVPAPVPAPACTCARACPCAEAPPLHAPIHVVTSMQVDARTPICDARPPRDDALQSQRLGVPIGRHGARLAPLVARIGDHG